MNPIWPYPTRDQGQYERIDQGWDLRVPVGTPIYAIASGAVSLSHDPRGFGDPYPVINLDEALHVNGRSYKAVYYGHNHPADGIGAGSRVAQGQIIAHALQVPGGNANGLPGWLEIGFFPPAPRLGSGAWTQAGQDMHDLLITAPVWGGVGDTGKVLMFI